MPTMDSMETKIFRFIFLVFPFLFLASTIQAQAANVYVSHSGGTGVACNGIPGGVTAISEASFNSGGSWGTGSGQIGPGTIVHFCGTLTGTTLGVSGTGTSGAGVITFVFDTVTNGNMTPSSCASGQVFWLGGGNGANYFKIIGKHDVTHPDISFPNNGSASLGYPTQCIFNGLDNLGHDVEVESMAIGPMFVHDPNDNTFISSSAGGCISTNGFSPGINLLLHDNILHDCATDGMLLTSLSSGGCINWQIYNNEIYNEDHTIEFGLPDSATVSCLQYHDNNFHDWAIWDTASNFLHHDGFFVQGNAGQILSGLLDYNNWFHGDMGHNNTSPIFYDLETQNNSCCALVENTIRANDVFQNSGTTAPWGNGIDIQGNLNETNVNNTVICGVVPSLGYALGGTSMVFENNISSGCSTFMEAITNQVNSFTNLDYNGYFNLVFGSGASAFSFNPTGCGTMGCQIGTTNGNSLALQFSEWQGLLVTAYGGSCPTSLFGECHSIQGASAVLNGTALPMSGSPVINAGTNLTSMCGTYAFICLDSSLGNTRTPTVRPATGPWTIGALNGGTSFAATPVISPASGTYTSPISITMTCGSPSPSMYYTIDGSTPTPSSTLYTGAFSQAIPITVKAICTSSGLGNSGVASNSYTLLVPVAGSPVSFAVEIH